MTSESVERAQTDQFRLLVETVRDYAIFLLDVDGRVMSWNAGAERINGYTADEIVGKHFSTFYPRPQARRGHPEYELRVAAEEGRYEEENWRVRKDGTTFWASVVITALRDEAGELVGFAKVVRDLTERRRSEEERNALLEQERRARLEAEDALRQLRAIGSVTEAALAHLDLDELLSSLLDRIKDLLEVDTVAVLLITDEGEALVTRAARGLEARDGRPIRIPMGAGFAGRIAAERLPIVLNDVEPGDVVNPILGESGVRSLLGVPLIVHGRVLGVLHVGTLRAARFLPGDVKLLEVVADRISMAIEHARLYEAATRANDQAAAAAEAVRLRDEFIGIAAHELRTPMTSAKAAAQLLRRTFAGTELTPAQARSVDTIDRQISKLARMVERLLDAARIEAKGATPELADTDLVALTAGVIEQWRALTDREIVLEAPGSVVVRLDPLRIDQVVTNLVENALKYSQDGPIEVAVAVADRTATLSVRDHGIGVDPKDRAKLFERFYQAHPGRSGMGLGLYIAHRIVESHGGTIGAEFPEDGGTRFVITLPLA